MVVGWGWSGGGCDGDGWSVKGVGCDGGRGGFDGEQAATVVVWMVAVARCGQRRWSDDAGEWRRVVASDIWDLIDRVTENIFGFARNTRRKSFRRLRRRVAGGGGGRRLGREMGCLCVLFVYK
nr:hypothetical protein [Tanacetum cinerariifolium]